MSDSGYRGFIRGIKGSTQEHLTDLEFKIKKETEKLEKITNSVAEKQSNFDNFMQYDKKVEDISNLGKQKKFSKKKEQWKIFKNTHEAIIDEKTWNTAQRLRENKQS